MNPEALLTKKVAKLETQLDHFETEWEYLDRILKECGFTKGILTLRTTIESLLERSEESL